MLLSMLLFGLSLQDFYGMIVYMLNLFICIDRLSPMQSSAYIGELKNIVQPIKFKSVEGEVEVLG